MFESLPKGSWSRKSQVLLSNVDFFIALYSLGLKNNNPGELFIDCWLVF